MNILVCGGILSAEDRMLLFTTALAVTLHVAAATPSVAVADLSPSAQPALAEALRKAPGVKGRAQPAAQTQAVIEDAKGLGLACKVADDACLEKLHVLLRTDELLAFSMERGSVKVARVVTGKPVARAKVRFTAPAGTARAALQALDAPEPTDVTAKSEGDTPRVLEAAEIAPSAGGGAGGEPVVEGVDAGGFSPMLVVGVVGGVVTAGCAAGALGTSAHLAALETGGNVNEGDYLAFEGVFNALLVCSAAGVVATGVGFGLYAIEGDDDVSPPSTTTTASPEADQ